MQKNALKGRIPKRWLEKHHLQKQNSRMEDGFCRDLAWNYSKTTFFLKKTALKSRIPKKALEQNHLQKQNSQKGDGFWRDLAWNYSKTKSRIPERRMVFEEI